MTDMLKELIEKVGNMQKQMKNAKRKMGTLRKNQKEILEIKNTVTELKSECLCWAHQ
jgi:prefoldin subunit 5